MSTPRTNRSPTRMTLPPILRVVTPLLTALLHRPTLYRDPLCFALISFVPVYISCSACFLYCVLTRCFCYAVVRRHRRRRFSAGRRLYVRNGRRVKKEYERYLRLLRLDTTIASATVADSPGSQVPAAVPLVHGVNTPGGSPHDSPPSVVPAPINVLDDEAEDFVHAALYLMDSIMDIPEFT